MQQTFSRRPAPKTRFHPRRPREKALHQRACSTDPPATVTVTGVTVYVPNPNPNVLVGRQTL